MSSSNERSNISRLVIIMSACSSSLSWMVFHLALLVTLVSQCEGGCLDAGLCCFGQNRSCITEGWRQDHSYGECYCDQACKTTLDCCHDYDLACPAVSCVVSEWNVWSGCLESCKPTLRTRQRQVIQKARNGGKSCPSLQQTAGCVEYHDEQGPCLQSLVPALITTGGYGNAWKKREISDTNNITGYCVEFELTSLTVGCQRSITPHTHWMRYLKEGHEVCVECQPPALAQGQRYCSGDGGSTTQERSLSLQWQAVGNSQCRGVWRRVRRRDSCSCPTVHSFIFI
ncbi:somatomedin-B and thrombospondin type-1 domain-containing protein-like [Xyrauchen texanus]|uniref:somatomedin-B and thrombospondin type-1 domain-containing protein-like n=1 Tax=Xyrauchen texanus TaxID=154827 RepID=UPI0022423B54|nr:somatomedin-B and thrombospondin type-1 domain-containing protein-like [Xyrauchen texanus]